MYIFIYLSMYIHICIRIYIYVCIHIHMYIYIYIYLCIHTHTHIHIYIHKYTNSYIYTCIHVYIQIRIQTPAKRLSSPVPKKRTATATLHSLQWYAISALSPHAAMTVVGRSGAAASFVMLRSCVSVDTSLRDISTTYLHTRTNIYIFVYIHPVSVLVFNSQHPKY